MTDAVIVALISSAATLLVVFLKLKLNKEKNKKTLKETEILLEDLKAKKVKIIFKEDGSDFDFISESSINTSKGTLFRFKIKEDLGYLEITFNNSILLSSDDRQKIKNYTNFLGRSFS